MSRVYSYMALGMLITTLTSLLFYKNETVASMIYTISDVAGQETRSFNLLGLVFLFAPIVLIFVKMAWVENKSWQWILSLYGVITFMMGATLSAIFLRYDVGTIYLALGTSTALFFGMSIIGATTKTDLSKMGSILISALWVLIVASIANWFFASTTLDWIITYCGVMIFLGLSAYDTQKLVSMSEEIEEHESMNTIQKQAILGGFTLYLDFVNLLLFTLRIFGVSNKD